jgi:hypothetical protein
MNKGFQVYVVQVTNLLEKENKPNLEDFVFLHGFRDVFVKEIPKFADIAQPQHVPTNLHSWCKFKEGEASSSRFSLRIQGMIQALIEDKMEDPNHAFIKFGDKVTINRLRAEGICI